MRFGLGHIQRSKFASDFVNPEALIYVGLLSTELDAPTKAAVDQLYTDLKAAGLFAKLDVLYIATPPDDDLNSSLINLINPGVHTMSVVGLVNLDTTNGAWRSGDPGNAAHYLNTNFNPRQDAVKASVDDMCMFVREFDNAANGTPLTTGYSMGCYSGESADYAAVVAVERSATTSEARGVINSAIVGLISSALTGGDIYDGNALVLIQRESASQQRMYRNGAERTATTEHTSSDLPDENVHLFGYGSNGSHFSSAGQPQLYAGVGAALSAEEAEALYEIMENWRAARGKPSYLDNGELAAILDAMASNPPSDARRKTINRLISDLKSVSMSSGASAWTNMTILYVTAAHDETAARVNWKDPSTMQLSTGSGFTANVGWALGAGNVTVTSPSLPTISRDNLVAGAYRDGWSNATVQYLFNINSLSAYYLRNLSNTFEGAISRNTAASTPSISTFYTSNPSMFIGGRASSTVEYFGASSGGSDAHPSFTVSRNLANYSPTSISFNQANRMFWMSSAQSDWLSTAGTRAAHRLAVAASFERYRTAIGSGG